MGDLRFGQGLFAVLFQKTFKALKYNMILSLTASTDQATLDVKMGISSHNRAFLSLFSPFGTP